MSQLRMLCAACLLFLSLSVQSVAEEAPPTRYQIASALNTAVMVDSKTGKTWYLESTGRGVVWLPVPRVDDANLANRLRKTIAGKSTAAASDELQEVLDADVALQSLRIALAKERADLRRLLKQFGAKHPKVLSSVERVKQLEQIDRDDATGGLDG